MGVFLVPIDDTWLSDTRMSEVLTRNLKEKVREAVEEVRATREFMHTPEAIRILEGPNFVQVELVGGKALALEQGVKPHQMTYLEGRTVPIRTPIGRIFRKATRLSMLMGKWHHPGTPPKSIVRQTIREKMHQSLLDTAAETKEELTAPLRLADVLGLRRSR